MKLLDKFMEKLGYAKVVQADFPREPENIQTQIGDQYDKVKNPPLDTFNTPSVIPSSNSGLVGDPNTNREGNPAKEEIVKRDVERFQNENKQDMNAFDTNRDNYDVTVIPSSENKPAINIVPTSLSPYIEDGAGADENINRVSPKERRSILTLNDVEAFNPILGKRMKVNGILFVDKEMFMDKYKEACKQAALKKIAVSHYLGANDE